MSFSTDLGALRDHLETDATLKAFCLARWGKELTARIRFRQRTEIKMTELPLVLITRPGVDTDPSYGNREPRHTVRLYAGFHQKDPEKGALDLVDFEDAILDAIERFEPTSDDIDGITLSQSRNDEGALAPSYFTVLDLICTTN